jgi:hypothetical protein
MGEGLQERRRPCSFDTEDGRSIEREDVLLASSKSGHLNLNARDLFLLRRSIDTHTHGLEHLKSGPWVQQSTR